MQSPQKTVTGGKVRLNYVHFVTVFNYNQSLYIMLHFVKVIIV